MKLEAVDQTGPSTMTVATVSQVVRRTMWVLLDGYKNDSVEHIYDVESFDLFPVGWCSMNGHPLVTPRVQRKIFKLMCNVIVCAATYSGQLPLVRTVYEQSVFPGLVCRASRKD